VAHGQQRRGPGILAAIACVSLVACAAEPPPVVTAVIDPGAPPPGTDPLTPSERLLALLTADNPRIERVAMSLAALGDTSVLRDAGARLVRLARAERGKEEYEAILAAMSHVKGPAVQAYCFAVAEDESAPRDRRVLALRVLSLVVDEGDPAGNERRTRATAHLPPPPLDPRSLGASGVVAYLHRAARACYRRALAEDPTSRGSARLTVRFARDGTVQSSVEGTVSDTFKRCLVYAANRFHVAEGLERETVLTVPFNIDPQ
jgi:hypothetical protein